MRKSYLVKGVKNGLMLVVFAVFSGSLFAQSDPTGEKRVTHTFAFKNATVTTAPGNTITGATIVVKNGIIENIGTNVRIPAEAQVIDADSLHIYPGFIDGAGKQGVGKPAEVERPAKLDPSNPPDEVAGITPWRNVLDNFDAKSSQINDWRKVGFTISNLVPEGGMLPGKTAIVLLGSESTNNILEQQNGLVMRFRGSGGGRGYGMYPGTQLGIMAKFRDVYKNAELSARHQNLFASNTGINRPEVNKTLTAFYPAINKQIPIMIEVSNDLQIRRALTLQKEMGFKLILVGVNEVERVIEPIKAANAQVLVSMKLPDDKVTKAKTDDLSEELKGRTERVLEAYKDALGQAAALEKAGIAFAFTSIDGKSNDLFKNLKLMVENGLSEKAALAALTTNPANILGIQRVAGTLEKGKLANMVMMTGPFLSDDAQVKHVMADGYLFDYETKTAKAKQNGDSENDGVDVSGLWEYTTDSPAGSSGGTIDIKKNGSNYEGTITFDNPAGGGKTSAPMNSIRVSGNELSFTFDVAAGGMSIEIEVTGDIDGNDMTGSLSLGDFGSFPMKASKKPNLNNL